ncbi:hypothetical protein [Neorhizobium sp. NCHU2750]|uniref:hypothetical protein n=1 Tax=Neorhizobium sp. NCHU2750 TaxID=1825976 RepID=UPI000E764277|nr:hypothetical protein NCHU2750_48580 [Neorhizobium sp. NCHU2750]
MSKDTSCKSCSFYEDHVVNAGSAPADAGLCRFNPPVSQPEVNSRGLWPVVSANDWCGQFEGDAKAA